MISITSSGFVSLFFVPSKSDGTKNSRCWYVCITEVTPLSSSTICAVLVEECGKRFYSQFPAKHCREKIHSLLQDDVGSEYEFGAKQGVESGNVSSVKAINDGVGGNSNATSGSPELILSRGLAAKYGWRAELIVTKWTPGNCGATNGHDVAICSRVGSVAAFY